MNYEIFLIILCVVSLIMFNFALIRKKKYKNHKSFYSLLNTSIFMDAQKIDMFIMSNGKNLPEDKTMIIRQRLEDTDESKWPIISTIQFKSTTTALILSIFLGYLGIDRFYIGDTLKGVLKLITGGACGIWVIIDWFLISKATREKNYDKINTIL